MLPTSSQTEILKPLCIPAFVGMASVTTATSGLVCLSRALSAPIRAFAAAAERGRFEDVEAERRCQRG